MRRVRRRVATLALAGLTSLGVVAGSATADRGGKQSNRGYGSWAKANGLKGAGAAQTADVDRDGLRNGGEYRSGTDPRDRDSDDDRVSDAFEDRDRDGLTNGVEDRLKTDPRKRDDLDDIDEGEIEVKGRVVSYAAPSSVTPGTLVIAFAGTQSSLQIPAGVKVRGESAIVAGAFVEVEIEREDGATKVKVKTEDDDEGTTTGSTTTSGKTTTGGTRTSRGGDDDRDD